MKTRRQHKASRRMMAFLLSLALVMADLTILPVTALADGTTGVTSEGAKKDVSGGNASASVRKLGGGK